MLRAMLQRRRIAGISALLIMHREDIPDSPAVELIGA